MTVTTGWNQPHPGTATRSECGCSPLCSYPCDLLRRPLAAASPLHVIHVVLMRPDIDVVRVTTDTIVTMMQHEAALRDRSVGQYVGYVMRVPVATVPLQGSVAPAAVRRPRARAPAPVPAVPSCPNVDPRPEGFGGTQVGRAIALLRAVSPWARWVAQYRCSAYFAT